MINLRNQHKHLATLQKKWKADAMRDAKYNLDRATQERRAGNVVLARGYMHEYNWDMKFGGMRGKIVNREERLGK
jgi:hypothetical protein